jgi:bile acid:Na+ symporter, BASS family
MIEQLVELDQIKINFSETGSHILNIILSFIMFGVALSINPREFATLFKKPIPIISGMVGQLIMLPLVTFLLVMFCHQLLTPTIAMGMILVAACPGGNISNFISQFSKGNVELSVSLTAITTVTALFMTPFNFSFYGNLYTKYISKHSHELLQPISIDPGQMFLTVFILLGIPLILGQLLVKIRPNVARQLAPTFQRLSIIAFILMIVLAFSNNIDIFLEYIYFIFIIVLVHNALALLTGYGVGAAFRLSAKDKRTTTIEVGIQNSGLGLALLLNPKIFPAEMPIGGMLLITAWWGIWHIISGLILGSYWHRKSVKRPLLK